MWITGRTYSKIIYLSFWVKNEAIFCANGAIRIAVGNAIIIPTQNDVNHINKKSSGKPMFIAVIKKDINNPINSDITAAKINLKYFLFSTFL